MMNTNSIKRQTYLNPLLFLCCVVIGVTQSKAQQAPTEKDMSAYLMVFHNDDTHSLHMALSHDGYTFSALNDGDPMIAGDTIADQKGIRDPHIYRGPDGAFDLARPDLHINAKQAGSREEVRGASARARRT